MSYGVDRLFKTPGVTMRAEFDASSLTTVTRNTVLRGLRSAYIKTSTYSSMGGRILMALLQTYTVTPWICGAHNLYVRNADKFLAIPKDDRQRMYDALTELSNAQKVLDASRGRSHVTYYVDQRERDIHALLFNPGSRRYDGLSVNLRKELRAQAVEVLMTGHSRAEEWREEREQLAQRVAAFETLDINVTALEY